MNKKQLIEFEDDIVKCYEAGMIKSPIHLSGGNEDQLIKIFKKVKKNDWVFSTWRSHYHALLKSNDPKWVKSEILNNRSIHMNSRKHKFFTSAIVGGILPIALGTALALKIKKKKNKVWCFIGDMASQCGIFNECFKFALGYDLPIRFITEDNGLGVYTPTEKVWKSKGMKCVYVAPDKERKLINYDYERKYPHYGTGHWIDF